MYKKYVYISSKWGQKFDSSNSFAGTGENSELLNRHFVINRHHFKTDEKQKISC